MRSRCVVVVSLLLALTACGGGGNEEAASTSETSTSEEATSPTEIPAVVRTPAPSTNQSPVASASVIVSEEATSPTEIPAVVSTPAPSTTPTPTPTPEPEKKKPTLDEQWDLDPGYPKVVAVSSLPDQVRNWYEMSGMERAVAVHPGVWAELPPGATVEDAILSGAFDGFCASKTAFERKYLDGEPTGGTCW